MAFSEEYTEITETTFSVICSKLEASLGLQLIGTEGEAEKDGYKFKYKFDATSCNLAVQCLEHPDHIFEFMIKHKLNELVNDTIKGK